MRSLRFGLLHLVIAVAACAILLGLLRWYGRHGLPVLLFSGGVVGTIGLFRLVGFKDVSDSWLGGGLGGAIGLACAGFIDGMLEPSGGPSAATFSQVLFGFVGLIPGLLFGMLSGALLRIAEKKGKTRRCLWH